MAEVAGTSENSIAETYLKFEHSDLYTAPYELRRFLAWYTGAALTATGYYVPLPFSAYLHVPPNVAAVVTLYNGERLPLGAGRHDLTAVLRRAKSPRPIPVSVQFVNMKRQSFTFIGVKAKNAAFHLELDLDLRLTLEVAAPEKVTEWNDPLGDVKSAFIQSVIKLVANRDYEACLTAMPDLLVKEVWPLVEASCAPRGLGVVEMMTTRLGVDKQYAEMQRTKLQEEHVQLEHQLKLKEMELREQRVDRDRVIQLRELQAQEDIFAMQQPGFRRKIMGDINAQLRNFNQDARLKTIESIGEVAKTLLEEIHAHPGRLSSEQEVQVLQRALDLLEKLALPVAPPSIPQQVRSNLAIDKAAPPGPADKPPLVVTPPPVALPISLEASPVGTKVR